MIFEGRLKRDRMTNSSQKPSTDGQHVARNFSWMTVKAALLALSEQEKRVFLDPWFDELREFLKLSLLNMQKDQPIENISK